jgi:anti-sigma factor ChrR (cupin superfamily)
MSEAAVLPASALASLPDPAGWRWVVARHRHLGLEENLILAGGYQNGDHHVDTGDWVVGAPGTEHTPETDPDEDCWCLSRIERPGLRFSGWPGALQRPSRR